MTGEMPRFVLEARMNPNTGAIIKAAMCGSALVIAGMGVALQHFGINDPLILGVLYLVALTDFVLAFIIPTVIEKQARSAYSFFDDRLVIKAGAANYTLAYENIERVEERIPRGGRSGEVVSVRLVTKRPSGIPFLGDEKAVILSSLPAYENPIAKIKEVVEKSRTS